MTFSLSSIRAFAFAAVLSLVGTLSVQASSHREAPLITADPLADNTDVYAFRSPNDTNTITIICNWIPFEKSDGGPNFYTFGENIRYEIHIKNNTTTAADDITYRFTFFRQNEDPTTFFRIRLGKENLRTRYRMEKSISGGAFLSLIDSGVVPPPNIGPRSINSAVGLNATSYDNLMRNAVTSASGNGGERVFCGQIDDPFFVDLGGIFDLGGVRQKGRGEKDGLRKQNCHTIALQIPIRSLQRAGLSTPSGILDPNFVIGVWASSSRPQIRTFNVDGTTSFSGNFVQVSRLGMPLTNEVIIPIGMKDRWNASSPFQDYANFREFFENPELELYIDSTKFAAAVPGLSDSLTIQARSYTVLGRVNFRIGQPGLFVLKGNPLLTGTSFDPNIFGAILLPDNASPRSADILPVFLTGVPNLSPYQLATGKTPGNPLSAGKPFINNLLASATVNGDMLRLNMAVPVTPRNSPDFSSLGIIQAAALGLTDPRFNTNTNLQFIPNMDGFPNGRRLEDDVVRIELQAIGGIVLAAIGLPYDDYVVGTPFPASRQLFRTVNFTAGPTENDTLLQAIFPYVQAPWVGFEGPTVTCNYTDTTTLDPPRDTMISTRGLNFSTPEMFFGAYPNPFKSNTTFTLRVSNPGQVSIKVYNMEGALVETVTEGYRVVNTYSVPWSASRLPAGSYFAVLSNNGTPVQTLKVINLK